MVTLKLKAHVLPPEALMYDKDMFSPGVREDIQACGDAIEALKKRFSCIDEITTSYGFDKGIVEYKIMFASGWVEKIMEELEEENHDFDGSRTLAEAAEERFCKEYLSGIIVEIAESFGHVARTYFER